MEKSRVSYRLEVVVSDDGSCCDSGTSRSRRGAVIVQVKDVNNNAPRFPDCSVYAPTVMERANVGTTVIQVVHHIILYSFSLSNSEFAICVFKKTVSLWTK